MIISWPPLASLTSNLTSPIFKGNFPHELCMPNVGFDKNTNEVKANSNVKLVNKLEFAVESVKKTTAQWSKMHFFTILMIFRCHILAKKHIFFQLKGKVNQF